MNKIKKLPKELFVAVSGGVDSVAMLHALYRKHNVIAAHYIHDSEYAITEHNFVSELCKRMGVPIVTEYQRPAEITSGKEAYWRDGRYKFFKSLPGLVCTGHTLDDAVEWYLFSCLRGTGHYMPYENANVVRPYLTTKKSDILEYANKHKLDWIEDPSNADPTFAKRNLVRASLLPAALAVNPGLYSVVKKGVIKNVQF